jgi:tRNA (guanine-N7-)-methyltransferase
VTAALTDGADPPTATSTHPFWIALFGRAAPVEIEIGSGDGTFLLETGARWPATNFLGIERSPAKARRLAVRVARLASPHVRTLRADATCVVDNLVPVASVAAYHVYFPDPWPKRRHAARRIFTPRLVAALARTLVPGGRLLLATDVYGYARLIRWCVLADGRFEECEAGPDHPGLTTGFARKYRAAGRPIYPSAYVVPATRPSR